jgi:flagellum-specific peptidoglycan hydrolase FlgJ
VLLCFSLASIVAQAQTASPKAVPAESSSGVGFSIETEMLTYRALESNSEAVACDVAGYLHSAEVSFKNLAGGSVCNVTSTGNGTNAGVVVLPFDRNVFADFQIWRSDLQTMAEFEQRGASACHAEPGGNPGSSKRGLAAAASAAATVGGVMGALTPAGAMLATGSGVLGLFAADHASSPTSGTIQDQAFMDDVSRELRAIDVPVLMPSVYTPYALSSIDPTRSPFLIALDKLLHTRDCLAADKAKNDADLKNIDAFLASLSAPTTPAKPAAAVAAPTADASATGTAVTPQPTAADTANKATAATPSHLQSVLSADGLAVRLGADAQTGQIPGDAPHHVLLLKALESGGSISRSSNLFGTKLSYSGGSVGTYALFGLNGDLECSGNVYDYAGFVSAKDFQKQLHAYTPDPSKELVFIRGGCRAR